MPFDRLLSVVALTPAQASLVAVRLLDAGSGVGAVTFTLSGDVVVDPPGVDGTTCVAELLEQLLQNARRLPSHPTQAQVVLLRRLEDAVRAPQLEPAARARELEAALADTLGPSATQRLAGEVAALVEAFVRITPSAPEPDERSASPSRPVSAAAGRPPGRSKALIHSRTRGRRVAVLVLVAAAVLAGSGYALGGGPVPGIVGSFGGDDRVPTAPDTTAPDHPSTGPDKQQPPDRAEVVASLAGRRAGAITGVVLEKTGSCSPGGLCPVTVTVHMQAASTTRPITWRVGAARLCRSGIAWSAPTTVTALAGWTTVYASSAVRIPPGHSLALVALTSAPARAQSRPVPVTGSLHC
ncbi:hypothetical protein FB382_000784 [Nocardioides ginsengisegetis]|uniref:Uncharacterized protein n=1 Tax=Nocardioides ginsengisegetis TaxID=661491 RepID=A0A7W3IXK9_9ACTN|nr:hypothetical protein [Nocardioides ginsengisegetis]MBA8802493.1 hypothetical protein [Nocardioides ginsengisegetis]